jgi:drug/metabolite transporter (DMT)-like permease
MIRARLLDWIVLIALVATWGSAFAALKTAVGELAPSWVVVGRLWIGALTLGALMLLKRQGVPQLRNPAWPWYVTVGVLGTAVPFLLFAGASTRLPSAVVAIVSGATPVFTALFAHVLISTERLTPERALGVLLGFVGIVTLVGPGALASFAPGSAEMAATLALAAALLGAVGYGVGGVLTRLAPSVSATTGAFMFCLAGALAATPLAVIVDGAPRWPGWEAALSILYLGVGPTGLASAGWVWLVVRRGAVFGSMATYLSPVWATLLGVAVLGERPGWPAYAALALILAGVVVASRPARVRPPEGSAAGSPAR